MRPEKSTLAGKDEVLTLAAMRKLLVTPGQKLVGGSGLLSSRSAVAHRVAENLLEREWVAVDEDSGAARLTDAGRDWLLDQDDPRLLLEDLLRAIESQTETLNKIEDLCRRHGERLADQQAALGAILAKSGVATTSTQAAAILQALVGHRQRGNPGDCSVAELFENLTSDGLILTVGQFHDTLRALREADRIRLTPWTGPLYQLPQPALALLIGHEVLYYVSLAPRARPA
jgi:hypothetical protein